MLYKFILIISLCGLVCAQNSPVFIWGSSSSPFKPALKSLSANDFSEIISTKLEDSMLIVFLEKNLQTSDFSQCKLKSGETCFSNLKTFETKTFYADVIKPVETVKSLAEDDKIESLDITQDKIFSSIKYEVGKILVITLTENSKNRYENLIEHDSIMSQIYKTVLDQGKVIAIYTSEENTKPTNRIRRQTEAQVEINLKGKDGDVGIMIYAKELTLKGKNVAVSAITVKKSNNDIAVTLTSDKGDIKFVVSQSSGYWVVNEITMGDDKYSTDIEAAIDFSYFCGNISLGSTDKRLVFNNLQLQAFYKVEPIKFGDPWHCVGFISGGIISGLFVALMFIVILSIGITWLMDIRTMDRFDDPKGKTITINATD